MKLKAILVTIFLFLSVLIYDFLQDSRANDIDELGKEVSKSLRIAYDSVLDTHKLLAEGEYYNLMKNQDALNILKQFKHTSADEKKILRGELYRLFASHYKYLRSLNVRQFHFHTTDGDSLLRFHLPYSNGDSLFDERYSIRVANTKLTPMHGFEGGKIYPGFRYVFPIVYGGEHLGSVEYSFSFEGIEKYMRKTFPEDVFQLHIDGSISYDKVFKWYRDYFESSIFGNNHYIENQDLSLVSNTIADNQRILTLNKDITSYQDFAQKIARHEDFNLPIEREGYIVSFFNINDIEGKHAAYLVSYSQNNALLDIQEKYTILLGLFYLGEVLVFLLGYIVFYQFDKIIKQNRQLGEVNIDQVKLIMQQNNEFETIFNTTHNGLAIIDFERNFLFINQAYLDITGFSKEELYKQLCDDAVIEEERMFTDSIIKDVIEKGKVRNIERRCVVANGKIIYISMSLTLMPDKKRILISLRDISEQKRGEQIIDEYMRLADEEIISSSTDLKGNITYVSKAFCEISGYTKDELLGQNHRIINHPDMPKETFGELWKTIKAEKTWKGEILNRKKDGGYYWIDAVIGPSYDLDGNKIGYTALRHDITDKKLIEKLSITDELTQLYNRRYFNETLPKMINRAKRHKQMLCLALLDIDHFKQYNDTYGHQKGDEALALVGKTLKSSLTRTDDYCFRIGGEEFGLLFLSENNEKGKAFCQEILQCIEGLHIEHKGNSASEYLTISMGMQCQESTSITNQDSLYKDADILLYKAKETGRNRVVCCCDNNTMV